MSSTANRERATVPKKAPPTSASTPTSTTKSGVVPKPPSAPPSSSRRSDATKVSSTTGLTSNRPVVPRSSSRRSKTSGVPTPASSATPRGSDMAVPTLRKSTSSSQPRTRPDSHVSASAADTANPHGERRPSTRHADPAAPTPAPALAPAKKASAGAGTGFSLDSPAYDNRNSGRRGCDDDYDDAGIIASSQLALARMSFEGAVVAAAQLQDLMMAHAAAVTGSSKQGGSPGTGPGAPSAAPRTLVDPQALSRRPLDEIADDLAAQLRDLCAAYESSSRAERQLMGVGAAGVPVMSPMGPKLSPAQLRAVQAAPAGAPGGASGAAGSSSPAPPPVISVPAADAEATRRKGTVRGTVKEIRMVAGDTFGPMASAKLLSSRDDFDTSAPSDNVPPVVQVPSLSYPEERGLGGGGRKDDDWLIDVGRANPGPRLAAQNTQFVYPDGTTVSFPISTFGEFVNAEFVTGSAVDDWANDVRAATSEALKNGAEGAARAQGGRGTVGASGGGDGTLSGRGNGTFGGGDPDLLHSYVKALEGKLSEKQRLEALREAQKSNRQGATIVTSAVTGTSEPGSNKEGIE